MAKWKTPEDIARIKKAKAKLDAKRKLPPPKTQKKVIDYDKGFKRDASDPISYENVPRETTKKKRKSKKKKEERQPKKRGRIKEDG